MKTIETTATNKRATIALVDTKHHSDGSRTDTYEVQILAGDELNQTRRCGLFYRAEATAPHGVEDYDPACTNDDGYYQEFGIDILNRELVDMDGVAFIPRTTARVLRSLGFTVGDECLSRPLTF